MPVFRGPGAIKQIFALIGLSILVALGFLWRTARNSVSDDPLVVAEEYRRALFDGDASEFYRLADHHEIELNGMSREDLRRFLNEWLRPKLIRVTDKSYDVYGNGSAGFQSFSWGISTADGRFPLTVSVAKTDDGMRVVQPLTSLLITFAAIKSNHLPASGPEKLLIYAENARKIAPEVAKYHFTTIQPDPNKAPMTIEQFASWSEERSRSVPMARRAGTLGGKPR